MELKYRYSESTVRPQEIEACKTTVYFRKNIKTEERTYGNVTQTFYTYQEAKMPIEEFKAMANNQALVNAMKGINDSDNQLVIMEALADLYDLISKISGGIS